MINSMIFKKAVLAGGKILDNGCVYTQRYSRRNPVRLIQRTIAPNGSYTIQISENGKIIKRVNKTFLNNNSTLTDSWDFTSNRGIYLGTVETAPGQAFLSRVFDKSGEHSIVQDGLVYLFRKGDSAKYQTAVKTLDGISSVAKPFSPMGWLNDQFCKLFNK